MKMFVSVLLMVVALVGFAFTAYALADKPVVEMLFLSGSPIEGATLDEATLEYKLGDDAFIDLGEVLTKRHKVMTLAYSSGFSTPSGVVVWQPFAVTYTLTDDDAAVGGTWLDVLPRGEKALYFRNNDELVRDVNVWATHREPGVAIGDDSMGQLKDQWSSE